MKIRQILESVSVGGMGTGSVATVSAPLGKVQRRVKKEDAAGVGIVTKQNATADVPVGGEYMNVKKFFPNKKKKDVSEVSLGSYLNKASMSRGQAQMGAMFGTDPEQRAKDLATFQKRDKGIERARPRAEKARKDAAEKARSDQLAADKANLPELIAQYQKLRNQYDPDFEYSDDHSFWSKQKDIQQSMHSLQKRINAAGGSLEENKKGVRAVKHTVKPRNFVAKNAAATTSGAGAHKDKKKAMKQGEVKHKGKELAYESKLWAALERKVNR